MRNPLTSLTSLAFAITAKQGKTPKKPWYVRKPKRCYDCSYVMQKALLGIFPIIVCLNHKDGVRGGGFWFWPAAVVAALFPGDGFTMMVYEDSYWSALRASIRGDKKVEPEGPTS